MRVSTLSHFLPCPAAAGNEAPSRLFRLARLGLPPMMPDRLHDLVAGMFHIAGDTGDPR